MIEINDVIINDDVLNTNFTCDLNDCKGACCTMESEFGAPLEAKEIDRIEESLAIVKEYLDKKNVKEIEANGFWEIKEDTLMIKSIDNKDCVFVKYKGDIAKCAIEQAYFDGKVKFRKPISCHLFPIRIADFGGPVLRYEKYHECKGALKLGEKTKISVFEFCKDSLERLYGKTWYAKAKEKLGSK
ncbi:MAG: DUF3109 family protein [Melioribacteraceae bacterium]|nr:DUF3109 family protein [Melioribacteraceae bacterium]